MGTELQEAGTPRLDVLSSGQIDAVQERANALLMNPSNRRRVVLSRAWTKQFSPEAGMYAVFDGGTLMYIGESGSLRARMTDLLDTRNHVLRRNLGHDLFHNETGYTPATSHRCFPPHLEEKLNSYLTANLSVSVVVVPFGRAELEEHLCARHCPKCNKKGKRGTKLHQTHGPVENT